MFQGTGLSSGRHLLLRSVAKYGSSLSISSQCSAGPHTGLGSPIREPGISKEQSTEGAEDTFQTTSAAGHFHSREEESASSKSGYHRSYPTENLFKKKKKLFILQFKILLNLYDIIQCLNTVMKYKCHCHEGLVQLACPEKEKGVLAIILQVQRAGFQVHLCPN